MSLDQYEVYPDVDDLMGEIRKYDLFEHVVELEAYGLTIVPAEKMRTSEGFAGRLRDAILRACERRNGVAIGDHLTSTIKGEEVSANNWDLLEEDEVFVEAAVNPVNLALVRWLLGQSAVFSGQAWIIKGSGDGAVFLHSDSHGVPPGAGQIAHMCNASWICTDYESAADGPTVFVPGSHHQARATLPHESELDNTPFRFVPLIAKAGSLAIWNGATWHASEARTKPGLRVTLVQNYMRAYMRPQRNYEVGTSPQLLQKYPELERVIGKSLYPYADSRNPDWERVPTFMRTGTDPFA